MGVGEREWRTIESNVSCQRSEVSGTIHRYEVSRIALIRPPMIGITEPPGSGDYGVSAGACS